jgi:hypothetical protein
MLACLSCSSQPISGVMTFDFLRAPAFCSVAFELVNLICLIKYFKGFDQSRPRSPSLKSSKQDTLAGLNVDVTRVA